MTGYFIQAFIYLAAAVIMVPLAKKLGLGSVLGYLIAGVIIGPVSGMVGEETITIQHFAEFGVVMMLFLVGLELHPQMLWQMRHRLLGLGGLQVTGSAVLLALIAWLLGQPVSVAVAIGLVFSLSSTAIVLQTFNEKGLTKTEGGHNAFSVLLMQDIAVIPILAFIPVLALPELVSAAQTMQTTAQHHESLSLVAGLPTWAYAGAIFASIAGVVVIGHYLSRPLFHYVANSGLREIFVATTLLLVIGIAALMSLVGLSPALGTFLAGVVLANSEFRHELESNIEPFKGLLLGLFFITVGAGINFAILSEHLLLIITLTLTVMLVKAGVLWVLAMLFKIRNSDRWLFALSLSQAGEFGFVLLSYALQNHVIPAATVSLLQLVVALSMFLTPMLFILYDKVILPRYQQTTNPQAYDDIQEQGQVIIAGIGRFGQIVNRLLIANGVHTVVMDLDVNQVESMRRIQVKAYFGDATRPELLHTAGIEQAALLVVAIDDRESARALVHAVKQNHPGVIVLARAFDRGHHYELKHAGADVIVSETYHSALDLGASALTCLGFEPALADQKKQAFWETEKAASEQLYDTWQHGSEGQQYDHDYRKLFIQTEEAIKQAMQSEITDEQGHMDKG
ncbi:MULTISPECIES: monovalent cation:proton antiporter-2 (CPA2) family protein [unclassified Pseudoalteromonas]|uniref:monovalent cation:proton antiporter-2 (CPA2) family protein n=1 Tax=unclassified Pseudoalteromonas TaxID=194690 RepID=UPI00209779E9|nr:monovalent cation:proton antiporter-2 (CPA2) family protein [Pseudoalteromonas sp. XMcav2-N]MCO7189132.1 monovalent cation:proton antiporter-2 (CPA2) family protein [Pseudoalteromonas sp. XMcav2-N]